MQNYKKILLIILATLIFLPNASHAQLDPRCWTRSKCVEARQGDESGFVSNSESTRVCGETNLTADANGEKETMGFCLPVGTIKTRVAFGGKTKFENIGDFIQNIYRYSIILAGFLAVIMIIVGGIQISTSGGSPERITSAKKRIGGAVAGLFLAVFSFVILNTINPYLVNLRLPQIWMINTVGLPPLYCSDVAKDTKLAFFREQSTQTLGTETLNQKLKEAFAEEKNIIEYKDILSKTECGSQYFTDSGQVCRGVKCSVLKEKCFPTEADSRLDECIKADILLTIHHSLSFLEFDWTYPWIDEDETELRGICENNNSKVFKIDVDTKTTNNPGNNTQRDVISINETNIKSKINRECGSIENFKGFVLVIEVNEKWDFTDEDHYIGVGGIDLGDESIFNSRKATLDKNKLIPLEKIDSNFGLIMGIEVGGIKDID